MPAAIVPTRGATGMDELVGLFKGWAVPFLILLDDDREGKAAAKRYVSDWHLPRSQVLTLVDVAPDLKGKDVRGFLADSDESIISDHYGLSVKANKSQVQLFFSEMLAQRRVVNLSADYQTRIEALAKKVEEYFASVSALQS